ncbi:hypothetical protein CO151_02435 [bacterium CG_4_9_14_3_um_filter_65_15]|nr:MAG: hypothetical protein CO151_02435 [bacterium CG_4_9_14_3_um_filter_65_15]
MAPPMGDLGLSVHQQGQARRVHVPQAAEFGVGGLAVDVVGPGPGGARCGSVAAACGHEGVGLQGSGVFMDVLGAGGGRGIRSQQQGAAGGAVQSRDHVGLDAQMKIQPLDDAQFARVAGVSGHSGGFVHHQPRSVAIQDQRQGRTHGCAVRNKVISSVRARFTRSSFMVASLLPGCSMVDGLPRLNPEVAVARRAP